MRVVVRVDAGALIGGGHTMRCLTLASALGARGAAVTFVSAAMPDALEQRIAASGHQLVRIPPSEELQREGAAWHEPRLSAAAQARDVDATAAAVGSADWLVVDHYLLDAGWHSVARRFAERVVVVDDLANRSYDCDLLVDETGGRTPADYDGLVSADTLVLSGASYALLRGEFAHERPAAIERRREPKHAERIFISLGMTDPDGLAARCVDAAVSAAPGSAIDVVVAQASPSLARLDETARLRSGIAVHVNSNRMAELMRDSDLAIGAAGTMSWERCCLGLPAIALVLAENQRPNAEALERAGAATSVNSVEEIAGALSGLVGDTARLHRMTAAAFAMTDGEGTKRVTHEMLRRDHQARPVRE